MRIRPLFFRTLAMAWVLLAVWPILAQAREGEPLRLKDGLSDAIPARFTTGKVNVAVVRQLNAGDVYQQWISGIQREADRLGVKLTIYNADGDNARQALQLRQAVATKPDGIIIGWGFGDSLKDGLAAARAANIPITAFDVEVPPSENVTTVDLSDAPSMRGLLDKLKADLGGQIKQVDVIYVYVAGYRPLDNRDRVFKQFLQDNPGVNVVSTIGVVNANTVAQTADQAKAVLIANPDVKAIIAPYDEFAKGAALAIEELGLQDRVKTYGMDISDADISVMVKEKSPWTVTMAHDPANVGAVVMRTNAAQIAGHTTGWILSVPQVPITAKELRDKNIQNMKQLVERIPALHTPSLMRAPWMDKLKP